MMKTVPGGPDVEVKDVEIAVAVERFSDYELSDGGKVRIKSVLTQLVEVVGQTAPDGSPLYLGQITPVIVAVHK